MKTKIAKSRRHAAVDGRRSVKQPVIPPAGPLPFRQVHLDFHTSEHIPDVGAEFDANAFAASLAAAHVDSVNLFARCHHGWLYYKSRAFPQLQHPGLGRDLLRAQIKACHRRGIRTPVYVTVQWDFQTAVAHPEWLVRDEKGAPRLQGPHEAGFYRTLCLNSPYVGFLHAILREVLEEVGGDGLWLDIVGAEDCSCQYCLDGMRKQGLDPHDAEVRRRYGVEVLYAFQRKTSRFIRSLRPECPIFYNSGHIGPRHRPVLEAFTHLELESLPSGGWGYLHFPATVRYARTLGRPYLGMTGKFHTAWGDFHSFKNRAALEFECFSMLSQGAACCVGDQLHPRGRLCADTYRLIGDVYRQIELKEPWCRGAVTVPEIGVLHPEAFSVSFGHTAMSRAALGVTALLEESGYQFDFIDRETPLDRYAVLILADDIPVDAALAKRLRAYLRKGGALLASGRSGLDPEGTAFALSELGVRYKGDAPFSPDFILPRGWVGEGLPATEHVMYTRGVKVALTGKAHAVAPVMAPYFNRTPEHFCSHLHTPSKRRTVSPAVVENGRCIYFSHPVFSLYRSHSPLWCKKMVLNALDRLVPSPLVRVEGPSTLRVSVLDQPAHARRILHLLHYVPVRRGESFDVVEDIIPLSDVRLSVRCGAKVRRVSLVPGNEALPFQRVGERVEFIVPRVSGHQMVCLEGCHGA